MVSTLWQFFKIIISPICLISCQHVKKEILMKSWNFTAVAQKVKGLWIFRYGGNFWPMAHDEYKPWKWSATARYHTSHTKTMLPTRKSVLRSSRQLDHTKTSWPLKRRKLQWYGHVSHSSGLAKTILQGTVKRGRKQGRKRKKWEDNIREWTGLEFAKSQRAAENREKWRKLVGKSSVVPQRPSWLRDRWEMRVWRRSTTGRVPHHETP